ncbi:MAG: PEP-CTERM system histidine kinase PrsK [Herminiimonas sp.]|nr:PEP-CTERM system histidine kinase PrsK [Herminiimonas sp.]
MLITITFYSYAACAAAFLIFSMLLLTRWRSPTGGVACSIASLLTMAWAATIAFNALSGHPISIASELLELLRDAAWTYLLARFVGPFRDEALGGGLGNLKPAMAAILLLYASMAMIKLLLYADVVEATGLLVFGASIFGPIVIAVVGMLLVEQVYRNCAAQERWGVKFACMGIGGLFAYDFYLFSDAMLFRAMNAEIWIARGAVNALTVPLLALSAARNPQWSLGLSVSRRVLFHSVTLFGSALYLLAMAAAGYYLRYFGGSWGTVMQGAFLFGALTLLMTVLFSGTFRAWLKVVISKHFYSYGYDYREEWLRFTRILSNDGPAIGDRALQAVAALVESTGGALFLSRESGKHELAASLNVALGDAAEPLDSAFCQFLEGRQWVIDLGEFKLIPEQYEGLSLPPWLAAMDGAWLVVPLILRNELCGFIVLAPSRSSIKLNWEVTDLLKIAGSQAASYLAQQESANALMVARQFESFNRMSTFIVHDLKNLVSQLSLLVSNAEKHKDNPEFQKDMLETVDLSVQKMKLLLQKLARSSAMETPVRLQMDKLLQKVIAAKMATEPHPVLEILDADLTVMAHPARLERVIGHLVQNAIEATPRDGSVLVRLLRWHDELVVECVDTGAGMSEVFMRERLFKPFETTKSAGMGIGVFESREYVQELGGRVEVMSQQPGGTTFRIILPLHVRQQPAAPHPASPIEPAIA